MSHTVTVRFIGICTHFSQATLLRVSQSPSSTALPKQRVVLVNATAGLVVHETRIPPHIPRLAFGQEQIALTGCTVRLRKETSASLPLELTLTDTFSALPNLTALMQSLPAFGEPSAEVVLDQDPKRTACYFDIDFGTLSACLDQNGAAVATLELESPDPITLEITSWDPSLPGMSHPLPSGTVVSVVNVDDPRIASNYPFVDFLLHYMTARTMPHTPQVPHALLLPHCPFDHPYQTVGAGCSNSNYP
jgi:hypothetical protein